MWIIDNTCLQLYTIHDPGELRTYSTYRQASESVGGNMLDATPNNQSTSSRTNMVGSHDTDFHVSDRNKSSVLELALKTRLALNSLISYLPASATSSSKKESIGLERPNTGLHTFIS